MAKDVLKPTIKEVIAQIIAIVDNPQVRKRLLEKGGELLRLIASTPPAPGIWNREPGTRGDGRWYQRGYGPRWRRSDGTIGGANTSERLQESWNVTPKDQYSTEVYTNVSYAPYLHDETQRVHWAASHNWKDTNQIAEEFTDDFVELVLDEIDDQIEKG